MEYILMMMMLWLLDRNFGNLKDTIKTLFLLVMYCFLWPSSVLLL